MAAERPAAEERRAADQRRVYWVKAELPAAEGPAAEPGPPACVEPGVEAAPGSMESALPAGRRRPPQGEVWPAAELRAVLVAGRQPWSLVTRLQLLSWSLLLLAAPASTQTKHLLVKYLAQTVK